jgi:2-phospho-L-lactate/phosphoenolpyruvate guanylyltransferase
MIWAIVPAKTLEHAKTRLARALSPDERRALSLAMLRDVLSALLRAHNLDRVAVVTADAALGAVADELGALVIPEISTGQNAALEAGAAYCREQGASALLVVSADLPLLSAAAVERLIAQGMQMQPSRLVLLAPSLDGTGTNAMFQRPPGVIPFLFGLNSLQRHQQAAAEREVPVELVRAREWAFDVDLPADLLDLAASPGQTHTQAALALMRLPQRLHEALYREPSFPWPQ